MGLTKKEQYGCYTCKLVEICHLHSLLDRERNLTAFFGGEVGDKEKKLASICKAFKGSTRG